MRTRTSVFVIAVASLFACAKKAAPGESIPEACRADNDGHDVHVAGYLQAPILIGCDKKDCSFQLTKTRDEHYDLRVVIPLGSGPSTMTPLPPPKASAIAFEATQVSVSIRDANGKSVDVHDFVRLSGKLTTRMSDGKLECDVAVAKIESL